MILVEDCFGRWSTHSHSNREVQKLEILHYTGFIQQVNSVSFHEKLKTFNCKIISAHA